jgi:hypothetical protein
MGTPHLDSLFASLQPWRCRRAITSVAPSFDCSPLKATTLHRWHPMIMFLAECFERYTAA